MEKVIVNGVEYEIVKLLAKGKGGYTYLARSGKITVVVKQIHYEPCDYYHFEENKLSSELRDYKTLSDLGIPMPELLAYEQSKQTLVKEYISGNTLAQIVADNQLNNGHIVQIFEMCKKLYPNRLNIDYFPTNFVEHQGVLYYVDYECSEYMDEWNFENWGIWFSANGEGMKTFLETGDYSAILENGKPKRNGFERKVAEWVRELGIGNHYKA